mmetsp:Transcript_53293/g.125137  ORF Transcript_53293/g.125137 Transcript_53293/m.125137 type:complete len:338 (-) Transcript_53293:476-1489(-)
MNIGAEQLEVGSLRGRVLRLPRGPRCGLGLGGGRFLAWLALGRHRELGMRCADLGRPHLVDGVDLVAVAGAGLDRALRIDAQVVQPRPQLGDAAAEALIAGEIDLGDVEDAAVLAGLELVEQRVLHLELGHVGDEVGHGEGTVAAGYFADDEGALDADHVRLLVDGRNRRAHVSRAGCTHPGGVWIWRGRARPTRRPQGAVDVKIACSGLSPEQRAVLQHCAGVSNAGEARCSSQHSGLSRTPKRLDTASQLHYRNPGRDRSQGVHATGIDVNHWQPKLQVGFRRRQTDKCAEPCQDTAAPLAPPRKDPCGCHGPGLGGEGRRARRPQASSGLPAPS